MFSIRPLVVNLVLLVATSVCHANGSPQAYSSAGVLPVSAKNLRSSSIRKSSLLFRVDQRVQTAKTAKGIGLLDTPAQYLYRNPVNCAPTGWIANWSLDLPGGVEEKEFAFEVEYTGEPDYYNQSCESGCKWAARWEYVFQRVEFRYAEHVVPTNSAPPFDTLTTAYIAAPNAATNWVKGIGMLTNYCRCMRYGSMICKTIWRKHYLPPPDCTIHTYSLDLPPDGPEFEIICDETETGVQFLAGEGDILFPDDHHPLHASGEINQGTSDW